MYASGRIRAGREHLTELHVGGAELDEPLPEADGVGLLLGDLLGGEIFLGGEQGDETLLLGDVAQAIAGEEPYDGGEAGEVLGREEHGGGRKHGARHRATTVSS